MVEPQRGELRIAGVSKTFRSRFGTIVRALENVDAVVPEGQFVCVVGPSGCGKTTLLRIIAGLERPSTGRIEFAVDAPGRPLCNVVFQEHGIYPWLTVLGNAAFGLRARGLAREARDAHAREYLNMLGLAPFERAYPHQLSAGMRQRVNLARAFANEPAVLLMDEPLANLDEKMRFLIEAELLRVWERARTIVVYVTHSIDEAIVLGDRVIVMSNRPGRIAASIDVTLPRPREVVELRSDADFFQVRSRVWAALRGQAL